MTVTPGGDNVVARGGGVVGPKYEPRPPRGAAALVFGVAVPVVGIAAGIAFLFLVTAPDDARALLRFAGTYILPLGILWAGPLNVALGVDPLQMVLLVTYFDNWFALFWIWNLDHLMRFRPVRRFVDASVMRSQRLMVKRPWLANTTFPGLILFIGLPLPGTGMVSGIILGKLIAVRGRFIYAAAMLGTTARVTILVYWAVGVLDLFSIYSI